MKSAVGNLLQLLGASTACRSVGGIAICLATTGAAAGADTVRDYTENGIVYRETIKVTQRMVPEVKYEQRPQLQYREQIHNEMQTQQRTVQVPITEYVIETYDPNRWNPFAAASTAQRYVPHTHWETRTEQVQVPVVRREVVPEQRMVTVAVQSQRMVQDEVRTRVALGPAPQTPPAGMAIVGTTQSQPAMVSGYPTVGTAAYAATPAAASRYDGAPTRPVYTANVPGSDPFANYQNRATELPAGAPWHASTPTATRR